MSAQKKPAQQTERAPLQDPPPPAFEVIQQDGRSLGLLPVSYIEGLIVSGILQPQDQLSVPQLGSIRLIDCELVKGFFEQREASAVEIEDGPNPVPPWLNSAPSGDLPREFSLDLEAPITAGISMDLDELAAEAEGFMLAPANIPEPTSATMVADADTPETNGEWSDFDPFEDMEPAIVPSPEAPKGDVNGEWCDYDPMGDEEPAPMDDLGLLQTGLRHMSERAYTDAGICFGQVQAPKLLDVARAGTAFARFMQHSGRSAKQQEVAAVEHILEISGGSAAVHIIAGRMAALLGQNKQALEHLAKGSNPQPDLPELRAMAVAISTRGPAVPANVASVAEVASVAKKEAAKAPKGPKVPSKARGPAQGILFVATLLGLMGLLMAAPLVQVAISTTLGWLFMGELLAISTAGGLLMLGPGMKLKAPELVNPTTSQVALSIGAGLLIGATLPSVGLGGHVLGTIAVRLGLALSIEFLLRGTVDRWLEERLGGILKPTLVSGALFGLIYAVAIASWVDSLALTAGLATAAGLCIAAIGFKNAAPRLATTAHVAAAIAGAVIVG